MLSSYVGTSNRNNSNRMAKQLGSLSYGATASDPRICTFNCRSLKNGIIDIKNLCDTRDIVLLQEHWLLPFELGILSEISNDDVYSQSNSDIYSKKTKQNRILLNDKQRNRHASKQDK